MKKKEKRKRDFDHQANDENGETKSFYLFLGLNAYKYDFKR